MLAADIDFLLSFRFHAKEIRNALSDQMALEVDRSNASGGLRP